jgi:thiol-disulfide isomerase/thioredoxin
VREKLRPRKLGATNNDTPGESVVSDHFSGKVRAGRPRRSRTRALVTGLALLCLAAAGCSDSGRSTEGGYVGTSASRVTVVPPEARKPAATVSGTKLGGTGTISTADYADKVVVINVWGSWCPPCRQEAPDLEKASRQTKDKAAFLGITTKDYDPAQAEAFVRKFQITYPSIYDPTGNVLLSFAGDLPPSAIPSTLVIDPQGRIAARVLGTISTDSLVDLVDDVAAGK